MLVFACPAYPQDLPHVRELVEAGVLPRNAVAKAQAEIDDRSDESILRRTLYGTVRVEDMSEAQSDEMLAAALRRLARVEKRAGDIRTLVDEGIYARSALQPLLDEREDRQATLRLAEARARIFHELLDMARAEAAVAATPVTDEPLPVVFRFDGNGVFNDLRFRRLQALFEKQFSRPLPISAYGDTSLHRALGYDHRGRVDLALNPDTPEGAWLIQCLEKEQIPFFAFRAAVAGAATGPHIHLGLPSLRYHVAD